MSVWDEQIAVAGMIQTHNIMMEGCHYAFSERSNDRELQANVDFRKAGAKEILWCIRWAFHEVIVENCTNRERGVFWR